MNNSDNLIKIARTWINTPWMHNQKSRGVGVDCVRFLEQVGREAGLDLAPLPDHYNRVSQKGAIAKYLNDNFIKVDRKIPTRADILLFNGHGLFNHVGIATSEHSVIHANQTIGYVCEHSIDGVWKHMLNKGGIWEIQWD